MTMTGRHYAGNRRRTADWCYIIHIVDEKLSTRLAVSVGLGMDLATIYQACHKYHQSFLPTFQQLLRPLGLDNLHYKLFKYNMLDLLLVHQTHFLTIAREKIINNPRLLRIKFWQTKHAKGHG